MRNLFGRTVKGLCRFYIPYFCNLTICRRFLVPRELVDIRYPTCEAIYCYKGPPIFEDVENCECYVHSCDSCGKGSCSCTINSMFRLCSCCGLHDRWFIIPQNFFVNIKIRVQTYLVRAVNLHLSYWIAQSDSCEQYLAVCVLTKTV